MTMEVGVSVDGSPRYIVVRAKNAEQAVRKAAKRLERQGITRFRVVTIAY